MEKIILTAKEIEVIKAQLNGKVEIWATEDVKTALMGVIRTADALMEELDAYDEVGENLVAWYWNKYQAQQETATTEE